MELLDQLWKSSAHAQRDSNLRHECKDGRCFCQRLHGQNREPNIKTELITTIIIIIIIRSNVSRLYLPRREGGRGLISVEDVINIEERNINVYVCQSQERLLKAAWKRTNVNEIETPKEYKEKMKRKRTEDWSGKQPHGQFKRETDDLSGVSWEWIRIG